MAASVGDLELVRQHLDEDPDSVRINVSERDFPKQNPESGGCIYIFGFGWTRTAHMLAHQFGHEEVFKLLMQRSPLGLRFAMACEVGDESLAKSLVEKHPDLIAKQSPRAFRRIIGAAVRNNTGAVSMMLAAGWPANVQGEHDQTPLHWAAFHGNVEMVRGLMLHHALLDGEEQQFKGTPLGWALYGSEHGWRRDTGDYPHSGRGTSPGRRESAEASGGTRCSGGGAGGNTTASGLVLGIGSARECYSRENHRFANLGPEGTAELQSCQISGCGRRSGID